jgi:hypothetical protein
MKTLRMVSVWSVLPLMLAVDVLIWFEDSLARVSARRRASHPARYMMR